MFSHILLPIDGSVPALAAARHGIALAASHHARVHAYYAIAPFHVMSYTPAAIEASAQEYAVVARRLAQDSLRAVRLAAEQAGVPYGESMTVCEPPSEGILLAARTQGCDLIVMATHGRRGLKSLLLGSQTQAVLADGALPVLVYRHP